MNPKDKWIEEVLNGAESIQPARADALLYHKIISRLEDAKSYPLSERISSAQVWRMAAGLLLIVSLNIFTCFMFSKNEGNTKTQMLKNFANEYSLTGNSYNY